MVNRALACAATLAAALFAAPSCAAPDDAATRYRLIEAEKQTVNIYKAYFPNLELARKAAISFHGQLLESDYAGGFLILELDAADMDKLRGFGFRFEQATEFIQRRNQVLSQLQTLQAARSAAGTQTGTQAGTQAGTGAGTAAVGDVTIQSIPSYSCYETVEETYAAAQAFVTAKPALATWVDVGDSWQKTQGAGGYDIQVLKLTNSAIVADKPKLFVNSAIHAREYTTAPLVLEFARWLVNGYGTNADATWILDHHEVHLMLQTNPDGRKKAESGLSWRKNTNNNFCANTNTRGIDLNRNFTFGWNSTAGQGSSGNACDLTYRGPSAGSEPETQAIQAYVRSLWPDRRGPNINDAAPADTSGIHLDIHSYSQLVLWPWGTTSTPAPNGTALQTLGRRFAYFNGYTPQQSIGLYPTDGTSDGVSYGELGVAAFTIELGSAFFESCTTYNNTTKPANLPALIYAAKVVRTPYITPGGPDVTTVSLSNGASGAGVQAGVNVTLTASATDTRFNNSNGTEPTQAINGAQFYIDTPPWQAGATAVALAASDGAFNATTEGLTGTINTAGLAVGKHIIYVRALDAGGTWGPVSAVFLNVVAGAPPLTASFTSSCSNLVCNFNGSGSSGSITSYQWAFGDATSGSGASTSHTYAAAGTFNVTLTVSDGSASNSQTQPVTVSAAPQPGTVTETTASNNTIATAQAITPNPATVNGTISASNDTDYYSVSLGAGKTLTATLTPNATSDYDLYLYNAAGTLIARSERGTGLVDTATTTNSGTAAVTIYVRVTRYSGGTGATNGKYTLGLSQ
jgi:PKD repeat protein/murein tripeptide amidase MpaA